MKAKLNPTLNTHCPSSQTLLPRSTLFSEIYAAAFNRLQALNPKTKHRPEIRSLLTCSLQLYLAGCTCSFSEYPSPNPPTNSYPSVFSCQALAGLLRDAAPAVTLHIVSVVQSMILAPQGPINNPLDAVSCPRSGPMCSALLQNPAFMNPLLAFVFLNAAEHPASDS